MNHSEQAYVKLKPNVALHFKPQADKNVLLHHLKCVTELVRKLHISKYQPNPQPNTHMTLIRSTPNEFRSILPTKRLRCDPVTEISVTKFAF